MKGVVKRPPLGLPIPTAAFVALLLLGGCDPIDDFGTAPGEVYRGEVIGSDHDGGVSFIRSGFPPHTEMELVFDVRRASSRIDPGGSAGEIRTYQCPGAEEECADDERLPGQFDGAPLQRFANLTHDALSQYDFPGGGRLRNYLFGTRFTAKADLDAGTAAATRDAMVFLSLMENGKIEVRVIAQSLLAADGTELEPALFGVFALERGSL